MVHGCPHLTAVVSGLGSSAGNSRQEQGPNHMSTPGAYRSWLELTGAPRCPSHLLIHRHAPVVADDPPGMVNRARRLGPGGSL